jgi:3-oxoacyl-[acyl-carrier protein] reductase
MKNILVTGCSRGIGYEIVKEFAGNENIQVLAVSRDNIGLEKLKKEFLSVNINSKIYTLSIDLLDKNSINEIVNVVQLNFNNKLDGIIHNAGFLIKKPFTDIDENELVDSFRINCFTPFILTQKLIPFFRKHAHIVSISSMGGVQGSKKFPGLSAYSTSKATLITLTECLAEEFQTTDFTFNCLALGAVNTEMLNTAFPGYNAPVSASEMGSFIVDFFFNGQKYFNGQVIPVSLTTP